MIYEVLGPTKCPVLFADLQVGIIERAATMDIKALRRSISALSKLAQIFGIPFIVTTAPGAGSPLVVDEIELELGKLPRHTRHTTDAFLDPATREAIEGSGRRVLLISGVATEIMVQLTALLGLATGFAVHIVVDAWGGINERTEKQHLIEDPGGGGVTIRNSHGRMRN